MSSSRATQASAHHAKDSVSTESQDRLTTLLADRYRIERTLGSGGMATVYLAQDVRHERKVALKVLKPELAAVIGAARFLAEIKTTANLHSPHILPLHDSGEIDGTVYYVMPFIEGESLRDRLTREKQLPISDATRIASAVADALQYAHAHGVIHRDIKPENILLQDAHAVVADFGIALAASSAGSRMTETGMSLGTPHYMSPEQAMGERDLDARTDIYALGCVLYEMLTGQPPFTGPTAQSIVAKVITEKPLPPSTLRSTVSEQLDDAVLTALEKLPADRFATASSFATAIADTATSTRAARARRVPATRTTPWRTISAGLAVVAVALLATSAWTWSRSARAPAGPTVFDAALPDSGLMTFAGAVTPAGYGTATTNISIAADGGFAVYPAMRGESTILWTRSLHDSRGGAIAGTEGGAAAKISPDGSRVAYLVANRVMVVPVAGGTAKQLGVVGSPATLQWVSPRQLVALHTDGNRLTTLDVETGLVRELEINRCIFGELLPDTNEMICSLNGISWILDLASGKTQTITVRDASGASEGVAQGSDFRIVDGRYVVYVSPSGDLSAASYDRESRALGRSVALVAGVRREGSGPAQFALSSSGTLVYAPGTDAEIVRIVVMRQGRAPEPLPVDASTYQRFDLSRDRRWLAAVLQSSQAQELRIYDLKDGQSFTWLRAPVIRHPLWSPDGTHLLTWIRNAERSSIVYGSPASATPPDTLFSANMPETAPDLVDFTEEHDAIAHDLARTQVFRFDPSARPFRFDTLGLEARFSSIAPGGRLIAYQTVDSRIMVTAFPPRANRTQLASQGVEPLWLSSSQIVYRAGVSWYTSRVDAVTGQAMGRPTLWAHDPRFSDTSGWSNRVSHDGGIIYVQGPAESSARYLRVVPNWVSQMKAAVDSVNR